MHHSKPSYEELFEENERLKEQFARFQAEHSDVETAKLNAQLNEYIEELTQTFETAKAQRDELEKNKIIFQLLEDNISDVIWMMDLDGNFTFISSSASTVFGYSPIELQKLKISDVLTKGSYRTYSVMLEKRIAKEKEGEPTGNVSVQLMHIRKNGEQFWAEVSSNPLHDSNKKLIGLVGVSRDITERIATEQELKKLSVVVEQSPVSIVITDINGAIQYVNSAFCKTTGYSLEEVIGKKNRILRSGKTPAKVYENLWSTIKKGEVWKGELINEKKNGENYWERIRISPIKNGEGEVISFVAIKENISPQKTVELELRVSQERYKLLSDISLEGIIIHEKGVILDANHSVTELTGYQIHELIGKESVEKLFTPESVKIIKKNVAEKYQSPYEVVALRKDGSTFPAEVEAREYVYKDREVRVAALRDITYHKRVEEVLRTSLRMNELLATHNEQEIIDWGLKEAVRLSNSTIGFFHYVNNDQNTISLQTWSKETLKNSDIPDKIESYPIAQVGTCVDCFHKKKPVIHNDYNALHHKKGLPDGRFPLNRYISLPVIEEDKVKIIFGVGNKKDDYTQFDVDVLGLFAKSVWMVIQRKRVERELRESNASKDKFFSIISHDLRSPIGSIQGLTEALLENMDTFEPEELKNYISTINKTITGTYNLVDNMLLWAQNQQNKVEFSPSVHDLDKFIDNVIHLEQIEASKKEITIEKFTKNNLTIKADGNMLSTVLRNLLFNAIKFTKRGGKIEISSSIYNNMAAAVCVKDNGIGISADKLLKLFEMDKATSTKGTENEKGTGLGLVLCKEFVERNGGKIWVESKPGEGSWFYFTIPLANSTD